MFAINRRSPKKMHPEENASLDSPSFHHNDGKKARKESLGFRMISLASKASIIFLFVAVFFSLREPSNTTTTGKSLRDQKALHGDSTSNNNTNVGPSIPGEYVYPNIMYGHVHMAKTGGTSVNGIFSNKFERVCGNKGHSYNAYSKNEHAKQIKGKVHSDGVNRKIVNEIGFENCDYLSHEIHWTFWINKFGDGKFHGIPMELHIPCRDRIDHLMSQCNFVHLELACDASSDEEFFESVEECFTNLKGRYHHNMGKHFDIKCIDFKKQFTTYTQYMADKLQPRRLESAPFVKRETNRPRNKTNECIWGRPDLFEKTNAYLLENVPYYQFCDTCMGSENEITRG